MEINFNVSRLYNAGNIFPRQFFPTPQDRYKISINYFNCVKKRMKKIVSLIRDADLKIQSSVMLRNEKKSFLFTKGQKASKSVAITRCIINNNRHQVLNNCGTIEKKSDSRSLREFAFANYLTAKRESIARDKADKKRRTFFRRRKRIVMRGGGRTFLISLCLMFSKPSCNSTYFFQ